MAKPLRLDLTKVTMPTAIERKKDMEYRLEYDVVRGSFSSTIVSGFPIVFDEKKVRKMALKNYRMAKRLFKPVAIRLYRNGVMVKGEH